MERKRHAFALIASLAFSLAFAEVGQAQAPASPPRRPHGFRNGGMQQFRPARQRWREMSPEDRQRVRSNATRWLQLPAEEREQLRLRDNLRRQRIRQEAEAALQNSGLQLEAEKRELYERRYMQERRRIERALRQELEEKRQRELAPVMENLKKEFTQPQDPGNAAGSSNTATPSPKK